MKVEMKRCQWDDRSPLDETGVPHDPRLAFVERSTAGSTYIRVFCGDKTGPDHPNGRLALAYFIDDPDGARTFVEHLRARGVEVDAS